MREPTTRNGERVTLARVYEIIDEQIEPRLRRVEFAVLALVVATASPKLGGPTVGQAVAAALSLL